MTQSVNEPSCTGSVLERRTVLIVLTTPEQDFRTAIRGCVGIERLGGGLYLTSVTNDEARCILAHFPHITFQRSRSVPRVRECTTTDPIEVSTYTVVAYGFSHPTAQQKKTVERLILRTPAVRLRPGVLLFPHLRTKDMARYYSSKSVHLLSPKEFVESVARVGARVYRWSRLKIVGSSGHVCIDKAIDTMIRHEMLSLERRIKQIRLAIDIPEISTKRIKMRIHELSTRLRLRRASLSVIGAVWHYDSQRLIRREYNMLLRLRRLLLSRPVTGVALAEPVTL